MLYIHVQITRVGVTGALDAWERRVKGREAHKWKVRGGGGALIRRPRGRSRYKWRRIIRVIRFNVQRKGLGLSEAAADPVLFFPRGVEDQV